MYKWFTVSLAAMAALFLTSRMIWAGEEVRLAAANKIESQNISATKSNKISKRAAALEVAAELGVLDAQLKLARMYVEGKEVPHSHAKAFGLYQRIVDDHADVRPHHASARDVAHAFVALASYYRNGVPGGDMKLDKRQASSLLWHAASFLGDAEAQCDLAQMYLDGEGVPHNGRLAVNWLTNAAKKRNGKAQALLGQLLLRGDKGVQRQPHKGLALLSLARQNASNNVEARWIDKLYSDAFSRSHLNERKHAAEIAKLWQARMGREGYVETLQEQASATATAEPANRAGAVQDTGVTSGFTTIGMNAKSAKR